LSDAAPSDIAVRMTAPILRTDRLLLAGHRPDDLDAIAAMWAHPAVYGKIGGVARSREEVWIRLLRHIGQWQAFGYGSWVLRDSAGGFVGEAGLMEARRAIDPPLALPEMGWTLAPAVHGRGYAREALDAILGWAAGRGIARTTCIIDPDNAPSLRLAARLGYATVRDAAYKGRTVRVLERQAPA
jgi:RimJ/RimL family protein N-acetyltransferase